MFESWMGRALLALFALEVAVVLIVGPRLIERIFRKRQLTPPSYNRRLGMCLLAGLVGILIWAVCFGGAFIWSLMSEMGGLFLILGFIVGAWGVLWVCNNLTLRRFLLSEQGLSRREKLASPGVLILLCCVVIWLAGISGAFASHHHRVRHLLHGIDMGKMHTLLVWYQEEHGRFPERLSELVPPQQEEESLWNGPQSFKLSDLVYLNLPGEVPGDVAMAWLSPHKSHSDFGYVLYHDGTVKEFKVEDFPAELQRSHERLVAWLNEQAVPTTQP